MLGNTRLTPTGATLTLALAATLAASSAIQAADADTVKLGQAIAFDTIRGNCLACHMIPGGESPGNIGPPLVAMQARFPERDVLHAQIWDATVRNPGSIMLPFGKHAILDAKEIDAVVDFLYTL